MSRRDYRLIADAIREALVSVNDRAPIEQVASVLADRMQHDNAAFDRRRFLCACGLE